jgi:hypothetical protein
LRASGWLFFESARHEEPKPFGPHPGRAEGKEDRTQFQIAREADTLEAHAKHKANRRLIVDGDEVDRPGPAAPQAVIVGGGRDQADRVMPAELGGVKPL